MEFKTKPQEETYHKVKEYLYSLFGETGVRPATNDLPGFYIPKGSSMISVSVTKFGDDESTIQVRAYVVLGAEITPDLALYLLRKNNEMLFGAFGIDNDNDIFFEHAILGEHVDKEELKASILAVGFVADKYDDEIVSKWGGKRCAD